MTDAPLTWYHTTAPSIPDRSAMSGTLRTKVCVVGGGLTGVSTALHLAERGIDCVLLESERIGHGASGRNGGQIVQGYSADMSKVENTVGAEDARVLWSMMREAIDDIPERVKRHKIDCDLRWGYLHAAYSKRQMDGLRGTVETYTKYGYDGCEIIGKADLGKVLGSDAYVGGMLDPDSGQIHPLAYLRGLAGAAEFLGAQIFERSPAVEITRGTTVSVRTVTGTVEADWLVLAGNAYLGKVFPSIRPRLMPVASFVAVTEPLDRDLLRALFPQDVAVADCNLALDYFRTTSDGRLLFGAGASYSAITPPGLANWMTRRMTKVFPELEGVGIDHVWGGLIGITANRLPDFGRVADNILHAQGFSGQGMALTGLAGKVMAETIDGNDSRFKLIEQIRHLPFPGGPFRTPTLVAAMGFAKLRDAMGF
jgi:gamma-glutamylputrescine oxidase